MSATAIRWAWDIQERLQISPSAHHVLLCLADHFNSKFDAAWPSYARIIKRTGLGERTVRRAIGELERLGLIKKVPRLSKSRRKVGLAYRFPLLDHSWATERASYDFDIHGDHDADVAAENKTDLEPPWDIDAIEREVGRRRQRSD